jgi:hypothetical protein
MALGFKGAEWIGMDQMHAAFARIGAGVDVAAQRNVVDASAFLIKEAMNNFEGAHAKGEPHVGGPKPNIVTGTLRRSIIGTGVKHDGLASYSNEVGPTARYGRRVELGMPGMGGAYPYFGPAVAVTRRVMPAIATSNWGRYVLP